MELYVNEPSLGELVERLKAKQREIISRFGSEDDFEMCAKCSERMDRIYARAERGTKKLRESDEYQAWKAAELKAHPGSELVEIMDSQ